MKDDMNLFEEAMEQLGTKRGARAAPRPERIKPAGVTVSEDLDFDAYMRAGHGPAEDLDAAAAAPAKEPVEAADAEPRAGAPRSAVERGRYGASREESQEFLRAMAELGTPPPDAVEVEAARPTSQAGSDLRRRLERRDVESEAVLDLHGANQKQARARLAAFIAEARREGWQIVTIVVGRGHHSNRHEAVLRPLVERWLREDHRDAVREVHAAPPYLGGGGAWVAAIRVG